MWIWSIRKYIGAQRMSPEIIIWNIGRSSTALKMPRKTGKIYKLLEVKVNQIIYTTRRVKLPLDTFSSRFQTTAVQCFWSMEEQNHFEIQFYVHLNPQSTPDSQKTYFAVSFWEYYLNIYHSRKLRIIIKKVVQWETRKTKTKQIPEWHRVQKAMFTN